MTANEDLSSDLEKLIINSGFRKTTDLLQRLMIPAPTFGTFYQHDFAVLLTVETSLGEAENGRKIKYHMEQSTDWALGLVRCLEQQGFRIDTYLIFLIPSAPATEAEKAIVRDIELDTSLCRKHIVWPKVLNDIDTLQTITVLALPKAKDGAFKIVDNFSLSEMAELALEKYSNLGAVDKVLEAMREKYANR